MQKTQTQTCPKCSGSGWIIRFDAQGREVVRACECRLNESRQSVIRQATLPKRFDGDSLKQTLTSVYPERDRAEFVTGCKAIKQWVDRFSKDTDVGFYLYSHTKGSGKTRMAVAIAKAILEKNKQTDDVNEFIKVKFITAADILTAIKSTWNNSEAMTEEELLYKLTTVDLLVIDDFGMEKVNDWVNEKIFQIVNDRYSNKKPMILTSNLSIEECKYDERIWNRLMECSIPLHFPEYSVRKDMAERRMEGLLND